MKELQKNMREALNLYVQEPNLNATGAHQKYHSFCGNFGIGNHGWIIHTGVPPI